jgi:hypothetical protein
MRFIFRDGPDTDALRRSKPANNGFSTSLGQ